MPPDLDIMLSRIAKRDNILELEEDIVLDKIARERDTKNARFLNHKQAWA
ncbi:MAG: hypothetical protein UU17_C0019G0027 [Candidatus Nomurabacteria bacterium GW2011_GWA1_40_8]|nr:MAG: hypothetical protein UU17_C0019G0027 [Candidatus Nomurabacteria bacterium GW2011_GWA1_40_8]